MLESALLPGVNGLLLQNLLLAIPYHFYLLVFFNLLGHDVLVEIQVFLYIFQLFGHFLSYFSRLFQVLLYLVYVLLSFYLIDLILNLWEIVPFFDVLRIISGPNSEMLVGELILDLLGFSPDVLSHRRLYVPEVHLLAEDWRLVLELPPNWLLPCWDPTHLS